MIIVDSTVWIDYLRGTENEHTLLLDAYIATDRLGLTDLILAEVLRGVRDEHAALLTLEKLSAFVIFEGGGEPLAVAAAAHYRFLRTRGITVRGMIDCLTATFCIRGSHSLLHRDRDFYAFEQHLGLKSLAPRTV